MKRGLLILVCVAATLAGCARSKNPEGETAAVEAAMIWLNLVDAGQYGASWDESAEYFKMSLSREQWEQMLGAVRTPLGNREKRELKAKRYKTSVPGAPDGHYVVIQFNTSFKNKAKAIETVTPMKDPDGQWRVAGYFIK